MDNEMNYTCDAKFEGNILVVGRTGCGKMTFVQNLGKNKMFDDIKELMWISIIPLSTERENNIRDCFLEQKVDLKYPNNVEDFDDLFDFCQRKKAPSNENYIGENKVLDRLIVMDDVSGLADQSEAFANFLTVSRKFGLTYVYVFHTNYPTRQHGKRYLHRQKYLLFSKVQCKLLP